MDKRVGKLYWRLALSSIQNIPDVSLSAQRAAEPDKVLWSWLRFPCFDWRWSIRNGIGWSGVSVISLVINSFRKLKQNKKLVGYCTQTNLVFTKSKGAFIKEKPLFNFDSQKHLSPHLPALHYEVFMSEVLLAHRVMYPLEFILSNTISTTCSNLPQIIWILKRQYTH